MRSADLTKEEIKFLWQSHLDKFHKNDKDCSIPFENNFDKRMKSQYITTKLLDFETYIENEVVKFTKEYWLILRTHVFRYGIHALLLKNRDKENELNTEELRDFQLTFIEEKLKEYEK